MWDEVLVNASGDVELALTPEELAEAEAFLASEPEQEQVVPCPVVVLGARQAAAAPARLGSVPAEGKAA
ncbi:hypothetical protein [Amycolatopsis sulphurea]|uniref:hypothetical protein n=1 Tax=Amycolatopsis sulphurea TaxID=76022 RepID=UPI0036A7FD5F